MTAAVGVIPSPALSTPSMRQVLVRRKVWVDVRQLLYKRV